MRRARDFHGRRGFRWCERVRQWIVELGRRQWNKSMVLIPPPAGSDKDLARPRTRGDDRRRVIFARHSHGRRRAGGREAVAQWIVEFGGSNIAFALSPAADQQNPARVWTRHNHRGGVSQAFAPHGGSLHDRVGERIVQIRGSAAAREQNPVGLRSGRNYRGGVAIISQPRPVTEGLRGRVVELGRSHGGSSIFATGN